MPYADPTKRRLHRTWQNMIYRCTHPEVSNYHLYGGRGIHVCDEWMEFYPFYEWALSNGYYMAPNRADCTLDRVDSNGDYCPENCRWVSMKVQANNTRSNHFIEFNGERLTVQQWADRLGISNQALQERLNRPDLWSLEEALTISAKKRAVKQMKTRKPVDQFDVHGRFIQHWGSISEAADALDIKHPHICRALRNFKFTAGGFRWKYSETEGS